jgi:hypothetical protein
VYKIRKYEAVLAVQDQRYEAVPGVGDPEVSSSSCVKDTREYEATPRLLSIREYIENNCCCIGSEKQLLRKSISEYKVSMK